MTTKHNGVGHRLHGLRKQRGWSQPEVGKKVGTSGGIIGRYERSEITPSIEVAKKLADVFGVTLDHLVSDREVPNILLKQVMLARWRDIDALEPFEQKRICP